MKSILRAQRSSFVVVGQICVRQKLFGPIQRYSTALLQNVNKCNVIGDFENEALGRRWSLPSKTLLKWIELWQLWQSLFLSDFFSYFWLLAWKLLSLSNFVICFLARKVRKMNYHRMWLLYHSDFVPFLISKEFEIHFRRWSKFWSFSFSSDWSTSLLAKSSTIDYPSKKILAKEGLNCWQKLVQVQGWNKNFF